MKTRQAIGQNNSDQSDPIAIDPALAETIAVAAAVQSRISELGLALVYQVRVASRDEVVMTGLNRLCVVSRRQYPPKWGVMDSGRTLEACAGPEAVAGFLAGFVAGQVKPEAEAA